MREARHYLGFKLDKTKPNSKELKAKIQIHICISMFIDTLFTIAKIWKQTKYPLMDE